MATAETRARARFKGRACNASLRIDKGSAAKKEKYERTLDRHLSVQLPVSFHRARLEQRYAQAALRVRRLRVEARFERLCVNGHEVVKRKIAHSSLDEHRERHPSSNQEAICRFFREMLRLGFFLSSNT